MPENHQGGEIFIVDDDPTVRDGLAGMFTQAGYRVAGFVDGASFVAAARQRIPACIILDLYLPGRSGLDMACRRLSRPTLCFAPSITGSFWASERTRGNAVGAETG